MWTEHARVERLSELCRLLAPDDPTLLDEVDEALTRPERCRQRLTARRPAASGAASDEVLPWWALIDGLEARGRLAECHRAVPRAELTARIDALLVQTGAAAPALADSERREPTERTELAERTEPAERPERRERGDGDAAEWLHEIGAALAGRDVALLSLDLGGDSYSLIVVESERVAAVVDAAAHAGSPAMTRWGRVVAPSPATEPAAAAATTLRPVTSPRACCAKVPFLLCTPPAGGGGAVAHGGGLLVTTHRHRCFSHWYDLSQWPPRIEVRSEITHGAARRRDGRWVVVAGDRPAFDPRGRVEVRLHDDPCARPVDRLDLFDPIAATCARLGFVGDRVVLLPHGGGQRRALVQEGGMLRPASGLPLRPDGSPSAFGVVALADGGDLVVWEGAGWERRADRFVITLRVALGANPGGFATAPAGADGFFFASARGELLEVARGTTTPRRHLATLALGRWTVASPGPGGSVLLRAWIEGGEHLGWLYFPEARALTPLPRDLLGRLEPYPLTWVPEADALVGFCAAGLVAVPAAPLLSLPRRTLAAE